MAAQYRDSHDSCSFLEIPLTFLSACTACPIHLPQARLNSLPQNSSRQTSPFHCGCHLPSKVKKGDCLMTSKLGLDAYDDNIKIWKGLAMPLIVHIHMEGMLCQNLFCSAWWLRDIERWGIILNYRTIILFIEWLKLLSFLDLTHGELWHGISAWFTVSFWQDNIKCSFPWLDSTVKVGGDWAAAFGNLLELRLFWMKILI